MSDSFLDKLTATGPRLPWLRQWLLEEVWSSDFTRRVLELNSFTRARRK